MPRTAGVSSSTRLAPMRLRPRPRTVARCFSLVPLGLFTNVTLKVFLSAMAIPGFPLGFEDLFDRLAALGSNFGRRGHLGQAVEGGAHDVVRVGRALALRQDV